MSDDLFADARQCISRLLITSLCPGEGEWKGDDYWPVSPLRSDSKPGSFHISATTGLWKDFASDEGGDIIQLVERLHNCDNVAAAKWILEQSGHEVPGKQTRAKKPKAKPVTPVPDSALPALKAETEREWVRTHHGVKSGSWLYRLADGSIAFGVARYDKTDGSKDVVPYYYGDDGKWHEGQAFAEGRPLYNLPELASRPDAPVLVVEGEKCAQAGRKALPGYVVVTWSAGASSAKKTDWTPLTGRAVTIWPDADEPGLKASQCIAGLVEKAEVLDIGEGRAAGWDIADAIAEGIDVAAFMAECPRLEGQLSGDSGELAEDEEEEPFRCVGYDANEYWFLLGSQRQPYTIAKGAFNGSKLGELAPPSWWAEHGAISDKGCIDVTRGQQIVIDRQNARGIFNPAILRGAGVWLDNGAIVINDGENIVDAGGELWPLAQYHGCGEYVRSSVRFGDMTGEDATASEGKALARLVECQRWARRLDAVAVLGWSLIAPFGGLLKFRPHIWISGRKGTGKTFVLENIVREVCGPFAHCGSGKDTEAGIRRTLNMDARPVVLDEMEPKGKARENVARILDLARNSSSDGSGRVTMADGKGTVSFLIRSCFCFASISTAVEEGAAIASRIVVAELVAPADREAEKRKIAESKRYYKDAMRDPGRYRRRIFRALPRIQGDAQKLREILPIYLGSARDADLWSPLLAAAWAVQSDESVSSEAGMEWLEALLVEEQQTRQAIPEDEDRVIEHILGATLESDDRKKRTVAEWLETSQTPGEPDSFVYAENLLARLGLRVMTWREKRVIAIATNSDQMQLLLRGTPYESGYDAQIKRNTICLTPDKPERERLAGMVKTCRLLDWHGFRKRYMEEAKDDVNANRW